MSGPDVRRWRFIVIGPAGAAGATRLGGRDMGTIVLVSSELDCERGRVVDDASLGSADAPFREVLLGAPEARFLCETVSICQKKVVVVTSHLFLITSVFSDNGRTTPCSFCHQKPVIVRSF